MKFLIVLLLLSCCAKRDHEIEPITQDQRIQFLIEKKVKYCEWGKEYLRQYDMNIQSCDSLLFTSLWAVACEDLPMEKFMNPDGQWFRTTSKDCYPDGGIYGDSKSTISRDMFRGLMLYVLKYKKHDLWDKTVEYAHDHYWVVGEAATPIDTLSRATLSPEMIDEFLDLQEKLDGVHLIAGVDDYDVLPLASGFEAHLDVLRVLLHGRLYGGVSSSERNMLRGQANQNPNNALFVLSSRLYDGGRDVSQALDVLENQMYFPDERLPSSAGRCTPYMWERDESPSEWGPCEPFVEHAGVDFVFAVSILE